jgi:hypothetical protein
MKFKKAPDEIPKHGQEILVREKRYSIKGDSYNYMIGFYRQDLQSISNHAFMESATGDYFNLLAFEWCELPGVDDESI